MRILLLSPLPPPAGGIATWTSLYLKSNQAKINHVDVVNTAVCGNRINNFTKKNFFDEIIRAIKIINDTKRHLRAENYDIVHINTSCSMFGMIREYFCLKKIKNKKTKIIIHYHCDTNYMVKGIFAEYVFKKLSKEGHKLFCLNSVSKMHIKELTNLESKIFPNFIDIRTLKFSDKKIGENVKNILYVGHITKAKGCDDIISVAKKMPNIKFKLIGYLSKEIQEIQATANTEYLGELSRDEVLNSMLKADLLLFPSHSEGFPNVVLEAMACGLPIIATPVGAIPDMIEDKGGILVNVGDTDKIIEAITKLEDTKIRKNISIWNKQKVEMNYLFNNVADRMFAEYLND